ncbi:hypothetical protein [Erythrobacter alti]|uniref:hypothetical protein n=1 Tax=Erythrobacter alti TaxID=1896145 RepID=UPI0030F3CF62
MKKTVAKFLPLAGTTIPIALILASQPAYAEGVSAGTLIENTANATFDDGSGTRTIDSNTVVVQVNELLDVTVTSLNTGPVAVTPGSAVLTFEITNTGNGPEAFQLSANPSVAGNDFDTVVDNIAIDRNGNNVYDPGIDEILTGPATTELLDAEANLTVFVLVTVPDGVADGEESDVDLLAEAVTGTGTPGTTFVGQGVDGTNAIVGLTGADDNAIGSMVVGLTSVDLIKSATISDPFGGSAAVPGAIVTYTVTANVSGSGAVDELIVTDRYPAGTRYRAGSLALDGTSLTDAVGDDEGDADTTQISVDLGTVAGGTARVITFDVIVN